MAVVTTDIPPDISPSDLLSRIRGPVVHAAPGYPEVIHLEVRDAEGARWRFSTNYAEYAPSDPELLLEKTVVAVDLERSGKLIMGFSDGSTFAVLPIPLDPQESGEYLETWNLITPDGLSLWYGPRGRWLMRRASDPPGPARP
jgi:hypothetical protein